MVGIKDVEDALKNIRPFIHKTPLIHSNSFSKLINADVYLKAENLQKTGSFKVRGAFNKLTQIKSGEHLGEILSALEIKGFVVKK